MIIIITLLYLLYMVFKGQRSKCWNIQSSRQFFFFFLNRGLNQFSVWLTEFGLSAPQALLDIHKM